MPGDPDQSVEKCERPRWVICESAWPWLLFNKELGMPGARLPMRKIRDMLRLTAAGMSSRKIAASLSIGGTTVVDCLQRARAPSKRGPGRPVGSPNRYTGALKELFLQAAEEVGNCQK